MADDLMVPEQEIACDFCDPQTSQPAFVTLHEKAPIFYTRELLEPDKDGFRICSFSDVAVRRIGAWLAKEAIKFWPKETLIVEDIHEKCFWIIRLSETDPELAFEKCEQTECCGRYVIGAYTFPWAYDPVADLEMAKNTPPW